MKLPRHQETVFREVAKEAVNSALDEVPTGPTLNPEANVSPMSLVRIRM